MEPLPLGLLVVHCCVSSSSLADDVRASRIDIEVCASKTALRARLYSSQTRFQTIAHAGSNTFHKNSGLLSRMASPCIAQAGIIAPVEPCHLVIDIMPRGGGLELRTLFPGFAKLGGALGWLSLFAKGEVLELPVVERYAGRIDSTVAGHEWECLRRRRVDVFGSERR
jgi:hypothetical protein